MTKDEKNTFLKNGGQLIRTRNSWRGIGFLVVVKTGSHDWSILHRYATSDERDAKFNELLQDVEHYQID